MRWLKVVSVVVALALLTAILLYTFSEGHDSSYRNMQEDLAKELGVRIQDYPYEWSFPSGYFDVVLKPGMTIAEVHGVVKGYDKVLHCQTYAEVYYYYSSDVSNEHIYVIAYDEQGVVWNLLAEDPESDVPFPKDGCDPGSIGE